MKLHLGKSLNLNDPLSLDHFASYSAAEKLSAAYMLADHVERKKNHVGQPQLDLAVSLMRQNLIDHPVDLESQILLARLLLWINELEEAIKLCDTVLATKGFDYLALHIRGVSRLQAGDISAGVKDLEVLNNLNPHHGLLAWNLANAYFHAGKLQEGWDVFSTANTILPNSYPDIPIWAGEDLADQTIVITQYNAQGGGDDMIYAHVIPDVIKIAKQCFVETDERAKPLYQNSFQDAVVFQSGEMPWLNNVVPDFQVMTSKLASIYRNKISDFERPAGYLRADEAAIETWKNRLTDIAGDTVKVGICWRSMISIGLTGVASTDIESWADIFKVEGVTFFELQYDESEQERLAAEKLFDIKIFRLEGIDLMQDFYQTAAVSAALDVVITTITTIDMIANAAGAKVFEIRSNPSALCMCSLPWYPNRTSFVKTYETTWPEVFNEVAGELQDFVGKKNVG